MHGFSLVLDEGSLPQPYNMERAAAGLEDFVRTAQADPGLSDFAQEYASDAGGRTLLAAIFGNSPFLSQCILRDIGFFRDFVLRGLDKPFETLLAGLNRPPTAAEVAPKNGDLAAHLRRAKARAALLVAVADIGGLWPVAQVTDALSRFAEGAIAAAVDFLVDQAKANGELGELRIGRRVGFEIKEAREGTGFVDR